MNLTQKKAKFETINIELENRREAVAFFSLIDKLEDYRFNEGSVMRLDKDEELLVIKFSDMNSSGDLTI